MNTQPRGIASMRTAKPTAAILNELRAAAHRDIDNIFDALPAMIDQADAPYREPKPGQTVADYDPDDKRADPNTIKALGGRPSDPTGNAGTTTNPARDWIRTMRKIVRQIHVLDTQTTAIIGPPICPNCKKDITAQQRTKQTDSGTRHERCSPHQRALPQIAA